MGHVNPNTVSSSHSLSVHPRHIAAGKLIFSKFTSSAFVARPQLCRVQPHELTKHFLLLCKSVALMKNPMFPLVLPPPISRITPFPTFSSPASICTPPPPAAALVLRACASARHFQSSSPSTACPRNNLCFYHPVSIILGLTMRLKGVTTYLKLPRNALGASPLAPTASPTTSLPTCSLPTVMCRHSHPSPSACLVLLLPPPTPPQSGLASGTNAQE